MTDDNDSVMLICANPGCRVAENGRCIEGIDLAACPHYGRELESHSEVGSDETEIVDGPLGVALVGAGTLTLAETSRLLRTGDARVIAIVGPSDAGKTSLIASLYDLFQEGALSGIEYARSQTLHAFEHTCHDARAASRRGTPHMNRTPRGEVRFYHLELGGGLAGDKLILALGDRAGEEYRETTDDASMVDAFPEIRRADSLTVLIDGKRLLDLGARHNLRSEITMILQAFVDGGAIQAYHRLALVLTKIDIVQESLHHARAAADFDSLSAHIRRIFGHAFSVIETFKVTASPETDALERGAGIPDLLSFWLKPTFARTQSLTTIAPARRAFARLVARDT
ncbi:TRAFAC clade GTPase domain-containing protein [Collimonas humicola]|uniref:TRAFAC clade GTPase domain-containing protein n=1 Tax=Collimonas humicola TaxID=2825886 RepID=UPI001B8BCA4D|nr:hypothetical protein [Collimonas humicola]